MDFFVLNIFYVDLCTPFLAKLRVIIFRYKTQSKAKIRIVPSH